MELDDLIRSLLAAETMADRDAAAARLSQYPGALDQIAQKLMSPDWAQRGLGLQFVTRCLPPPPVFAPGVIHCLRNPLGDDPLGDEMALVLWCMGALAEHVSGFRDALARRVHDVDRAEGERAPVMRKLAHETLEKIDAAIAEQQKRWQAEIEALAALVSSGQRDEAAAKIEAGAADAFYPEAARAAQWEAIGDELADRRDSDSAQYCYARAEDDFRWFASYSSAGAEGLARMVDVDRVVAKRRPR